MAQLSTAWVSDLRDRFLESGNYVICQGVLWFFDQTDCVWKSSTYIEIPRLASSFLDENEFERPGAKSWIQVINNIQHRKELVAALWTHPPLWDPHFFADAPAGLAVGKTFIRVTADSIHSEPLKMEHRARHTLDIDLPADLDSLKEPGKFLTALRRMFGKGPDGDLKLEVFREFLGACRVGRVTAYERCIIMPGGGSNGKSTIIMAAAEALFSKHERRSIVPNFLNQEYYLMEMRDAALNFVTELPKEKINCTERFKQIISGEDVTGRPIREMPVTFRPNAGHIFACNNFPKLSDNSKGMWRRLLVLKSDTTFAKNDGTRADLVEQFKTEAPQMLMWVLRGAQNLMRRGDFVLPQSHVDEEKQWRGVNDKALQFVKNCTRGVGSGWTKGAAVHKVFLEWCQSMGFSGQERLDSSDFGAALRHVDGFDAKRQSYGMAYNFVLNPRAQWLDYAHGPEDTTEIQLEEEKV